MIGEHGDSAVFLLDFATIGALPPRGLADRRGIELTPELVLPDARAGRPQRRVPGPRAQGLDPATASAHGQRARPRCVGREHGAIIPVSVRVGDDISASLPCALGPDSPSAPLWPTMTETERAAWEHSLDVIRKENAHLPF